MNNPIKLSSRETNEFWEIPVLFEDAHLLVLDKPGGMLTSPDTLNPARPSLMHLLHKAIAESKPWATERGLGYLMNTNWLDEEASGVFLLVRNKASFQNMADFFGASNPGRKYLVLVQGSPLEERFEVDVKLAPDPVRPGSMRVQARSGKRARTAFQLVERFSKYALLSAELFTDRKHQVQLHLRHAGLPVVGDSFYGAKPFLLSRLKKDYRLKPERTERPLLNRPAIHSAELSFPHPETGESVTIHAPCPKDFNVAIKYLRRYGLPESPPPFPTELQPQP
jgi:RluA family pseudouridine synthase